MENKKHVIYIAGPMTGIEDHNVPAFREAENYLLSLGSDITVKNPADNEDPSLTWQDYMRLSLVMISESTAMYFLNGWEKSRGATLEHTIGKALGLKIIYEVSDEEQTN